MARKVRNYDFRKGKNGGKYPSEWLDGSIWEITQGEDFQVKPRTALQSIVKMAKEQGKKVRSRIVDDKVTFQAYTNGEETSGD